MVATSSRLSAPLEWGADYGVHDTHMVRINVAWSVLLWLVLQFNQALQALIQVVIFPLKFLFPPLANFFRSHLLRFGWTPAFLSLKYSSKIRIVQTGDSVPDDGLIGVIANHQSYCDSFIISYFLRCIGRADGGMMWVIWRTFLMFPLGWASKMSEHIFVGYGKELDLAATAQACKRLRRRGFHSLIFFPEGAVRRASTMQKSREYALTQGLPQYQHVLCPKTGAFTVVTQALLHEGAVDYIDLTIAFPDHSETGRVWNAQPFDIWAVMGMTRRPQDVHIHVTRTPLPKVGGTEEEQREWLFALYRRKDQLLSEFRTNGSFPGTQQVLVPSARSLARDVFLWSGILTSCVFGLRSLALPLMFPF
mmetsp:Transcript_16105/g.32247  ORF Transcript_16105/g.32247 Transcript_16105/m.32247 type:complete len:364 (-) Transcript_16105:190-1281(-)|eukprot:CAMPEP_0181295550 /NCGR_PEP_ID=MMETSP1101-20121128/4210_1 /TAXON_ID=46948 /ORGANISM="Rhodomonas abbreviata, Strain Caron Lab Isolate" /LENGTH=363 /DNA_ID=CAMNT_0023400315 /DNA_START=97 /DNA_END=1188 /DNA_ORIENTATION=+